MIHHLSSPKRSSVNDFIPDYCSTVKYASVGDAIKLLKRLGHGCFMAKTDVKSAFRIIPIHPADFSLLGMKWDNMYYFDHCLGMELSSSCAIFESFSTALEWLSINHLGACAVVHILDDFLFIAKSKEKCVGDLQNFIRMCNHLGVPLAPEKTVGPATVSYSSRESLLILSDKRRASPKTNFKNVVRCYMISRSDARSVLENFNL